MFRANVENKLRPWDKSDGEFIHLAALNKALPGQRWDLRLIGYVGNGRAGKTIPILGRTRMNAVVVLISSMREWLLHYSPGCFSPVESMIDDLRKAEVDYLRNLNEVRAEVRVKSGEKPGRKATPKVAKATRRVAPKFTNKELLGVWK